MKEPKTILDGESEPRIRLKVICPLCGGNADESMNIAFSSETIDKSSGREVYQYHDEGITCCNLCGTYLKKVLMHKAYQMMEETKEIKREKNQQ